MPKVAKPFFAPKTTSPAPTPVSRPGASTEGSLDATFASGAETLITSMGRKPEIRSQRRTLLGG